MDSLWNGQFAKIFREATGDPQLQWVDTIENRGLIRYLEFLNAERIIPTKPTVLHEVLQSKSYIFEKPALIRNAIGQILGIRGILFSEGEVHKMQRKHMLPAFSYRHLRGLVPTFWEKSIELIKRVGEDVRGYQGDDKTEKTGVVIEMGRWLNRATLDIIGSAGMGYEFNTLTGDDTELSKAYKTVFQPVSGGVIIFRTLAQFFPRWLVRLIPTQRAKDIRKAAKTITDLCMNMVKEKQRELDLGETVGNKGA